jgi:hypothetical protein
LRPEKPEMLRATMPPQKPVVRHLVTCERVERSADNRHYSLVNLIHAIRPLPGADFPRIQPEIYLFALLTDGRGSITFTVELVTWTDGEEESIYETPGVILNLGSDPLAVQAWPIRLRNLPFPRPGLYEFLIRCEGEILAREPILLKESR